MKIKFLASFLYFTLFLPRELPLFGKKTAVTISVFMDWINHTLRRGIFAPSRFVCDKFFLKKDFYFESI